MAADRERQQQRAAGLPSFTIAVQSNRQRDRTDRGADHDGGRDQSRVPYHDAGDLEGRHAGVMHRGNAAGDNGAADPGTGTPLHQGYREADTGERDGGDQRHHG